MEPPRNEEWGQMTEFYKRDPSLELTWPPGTHPVEQSRFWTPVQLYLWQIQVLCAVSLSHSRVIYSTCNESGKTSTVGLIFILSVMARFPGSYTFVTSASDTQVREQFFMKYLYPMAMRFKHRGWRATTSESQMKLFMPNGSTCLAYVCKDEKKFEGMHGHWDERYDEVLGKRVAYYRPCAMLNDEAKGTPDEIGEQAIRRINPDFALWQSTPNSDNRSGFFYRGINPDELDVHTSRFKEDTSRDNSNPFQPDAKHSFPGEYYTYRRIVKFKECPHLHTPENARERRNMEEKHGRNSSFIKSSVYGEFPDASDDNSIFLPKHILSMQRAMSGQNKWVDGDIRAAADVSGEGSADSILMIRKGTRILDIDTTQCGDELAQAEYWVKKLRSLNIEPYQFCMDGQGMGATVEKYMRRLGYTGVNLFMANTLPLYTPTDKNVKFQYKDRYTEIHYFIRDALLQFNILSLPQNDKLIRDMRLRRYVVSGADNSLKTEEKYGPNGCVQREKCSPDSLDTLVYCFSDFNPSTLENMTPVESKKPDENAPTKMEQDAIDSDRGSDSFSILPAQESFEDLYRNGLTK